MATGEQAGELVQVGARPGLPTAERECQENAAHRTVQSVQSLLLWREEIDKEHKIKQNLAKSTCGMLKQVQHYLRKTSKYRKS